MLYNGSTPLMNNKELLNIFYWKLLLSLNLRLNLYKISVEFFEQGIWNWIFIFEIDL